MKRALAIATLVAAGLQIAGCANDDIKPDNAAASPVLKGCPAGLPGPAMVALPTPSGGTYCMDAAPVTQGQYLEFVQKVTGTTNPDEYVKSIESLAPGTIEIPDRCKGNKRLAPYEQVEVGCANMPFAFDKGGGHPDYPVACVDWCDAYAYCAWAGKRLCGAFGGGPVALSDSTTPDKAEWMWACTQGGRTAYPYGDTYDSGRCAKTADEPSEAVSQTCKGQVGSFSEVTNLVGRAGEWQDNCSDTVGPQPACAVHALFAANSHDEVVAYRCDTTSRIPALDLDVEIGFRCCLD